MPIGPALPPHLAHLNGSNKLEEREDEESDEEDAFGPALPPHLAAARKAPQAGPSRPPTGQFESPSPPRIPGSSRGPIGPTLGGGHVDDDEDSDDDDVIGPVLPTEGVTEKSAAEEFMERERRMQERKDAEEGPKKPQRESWMLVPPSSGILASATDPLRKRPTTFSRTNKEVEVDHSAWTEMPAEKAQRIADERAGIKRKKGGESRGVDEGVESARKRQRDEEIRREVERHNKEVRGKSLLDQHTSRDKKKDDPPAIWDHARDMGVTGRLLNDEERGQKIRDAKNLNDRFGHSKRGAYDM